MPGASTLTPYKLWSKWEGFLGKLGGKLNISIIVHFWYIYAILQAEVFYNA